MNLTQVASITRKGIIAFVALLILGTIAAVGYRIWYDYYIASLPPKVELPNYKLGASLPKVNFPALNVSSASAYPSTSNYSYSVDTETGGFKPSPKIIKVYFLPKANMASLTTYDQTQKLAEKLGFSANREILSTTSYKFLDKNNGFIIIDLITGNFIYQKPAPSPSDKPNAVFPVESSLIEYFKNYLRENNLLTGDFDSGRGKVIYDNLDPQKANTAQVSIWPADFDQLPIVTPYKNISLLRAEIGKNEKGEPVVYKLTYTYWPIDQTTFGTYPLKTTDQAFSDLQNGKGFVSLPSKKAKVSITGASLAYFESEDYSPYLQPVYVFEGPDFSAVVPAITGN